MFKVNKPGKGTPYVTIEGTGPDRKVVEHASKKAAHEHGMALRREGKTAFSYSKESAHQYGLLPGGANDPALSSDAAFSKAAASAPQARNVPVMHDYRPAGGTFAERSAAMSAAVTSAKRGSAGPARAGDVLAKANAQRFSSEARSASEEAMRAGADASSVNEAGRDLHRAAAALHARAAMAHAGIGGSAHERQQHQAEATKHQNIAAPRATASAKPEGYGKFGGVDAPPKPGQSGHEADSEKAAQHRANEKHARSIGEHHIAERHAKEASIYERMAKASAPNTYPHTAAQAPQHAPGSAVHHAETLDKQSRAAELSRQAYEHSKVAAASNLEEHHKAAAAAHMKAESAYKGVRNRSAALITAALRSYTVMKPCTTTPTSTRERLYVERSTPRLASPALASAAVTSSR